MSEDHSAYIEKLRARQRQKIAERMQPSSWRMQALEPIEQFAESLAEAGEISSFRSMEERFLCAILVCSEMRDRLSSGGSIQVSCHYAHPARVSGQVFWRLGVEAVGKKPRFFNGTADYREILNYLVLCIADQKANTIAEG